MAWVAPPTFNSGDVLTATQLNTLSDAVNYLNALGGAPSPGFLQQIIYGTNANVIYSVWHRHNYLHLWCAVTAGNKPNPFRIYIYPSGYPGSNINVTPTFDGNGPWHLIADISSAGIAVGTRYDVEIRISSSSGDRFAVRYLAEMTASS